MTKKIILAFINTLLLISSVFAQKVEISKDTLKFNIRGFTGPSIKFRNNYYLFFKSHNSYTSESTENFYVLNENDKHIKNISVPDSLQSSYNDLYTKNDTVYCTSYYGKGTFFLKNDTWVRTKEDDDLIYEDDDYIITSIDLGEWGGITWFIDKSSKSEYSISIATPVVNKLNGKYYLTTGHNVYEISNPRKLQKSKTLYEERSNKSKVIANQISYKGSVILFRDDSNEWESKFHIATSFNAKGNLYHICTDSIGTFTGIINDKKMEVVYRFKDGITPFRWSGNYRNRILINNYQSLQFSTAKTKVNGIMEIDNGKITINYFTNLYEEPVMGTEKSEQWFETIFPIYYAQLGTLKLNDADAIEKKFGATDLKQRGRFESSRRRDDLKTPIIYRKIEDKTFLLHTLYYSSKVNNEVKIISFAWGTNDLDKTYPEFFSKEYKNAEINKTRAFNNKAALVKKYLIEKLGKPQKYNSGSNYTQALWEIGNKTVTLNCDDSSVSLELYVK